MKAYTAAGALLLAVALSGCVQQAGPGVPPIDPADPLPATMRSCLDAYPSPLGGTDIAEASILPEGWPPTPANAILCSAAMTSDTSAVVQYVTSLGPDELLAYYEPLLAEYSPVISEGLGGNPILNGSLGEFEFAIQTDATGGTYFVGATLGE